MQRTQLKAFESSVFEQIDMFLVLVYIWLTQCVETCTIASFLPANVWMFELIWIEDHTYGYGLQANPFTCGHGDPHRSGLRNRSTIHMSRKVVIINREKCEKYWQNGNKTNEKQIQSQSRMK